MSRRLATYVTVRDDKHRAFSFGPADDVPAWAVKAITLRSAWTEDDGAAPADPQPSEAAPVQSGQDDGRDDTLTSPPVEQGTAPRRRGRPRKAT